MVITGIGGRCRERYVRPWSKPSYPSLDSHHRDQGTFPGSGKHFRWRDASHFIMASTQKAVVKPGLSASLKLRQWRWKPKSSVNRSIVQVRFSGGSVSNTDLRISLIEGTSLSLATVVTVHVSKVVCDVARESSRLRPILTAAIMGPE